MVKKRDVALQAARELVRGRICECGNHVNDHTNEAMARGGYRHLIPPLLGFSEFVKCRRFQPVQFIVNRKGPR